MFNTKYQKTFLIIFSFGSPEILSIIFESILKIKFKNKGSEVIRCKINTSGFFVFIKFKSGKYSPMFKSWVESLGYEYVQKPDSWASTGVADRHAK